MSSDKQSELAQRVLDCRTRKDAIMIGAELAFLFCKGGFRPSALGDQFAEAICDVSDAAWRARQATKEPIP